MSAASRLLALGVELDHGIEMNIAIGGCIVALALSHDAATFLHEGDGGGNLAERHARVPARLAAA